jgi:hypothetical protein
MNNKKEDKPMGTASEVTETIHDRSAVLSYKQVHNYTDRMVERGHAEYNQGAILVKSKHPLDQCLRRGIIEEHHADSGKRIMTIRDCAFSRTSGRIYNDLGEGDSGIDAMTLFTETSRAMKKIGNPKFGGLWGIIKLVCFSDPNIEGNFFSEAEYAALYQLAPNIQNAFEELDKALGNARDAIKDRLEKSIAP